MSTQFRFKTLCLTTAPIRTRTHTDAFSMDARKISTRHWDFAVVFHMPDLHLAKNQEVNRKKKEELLTVYRDLQSPSRDGRRSGDMHTGCWTIRLYYFAVAMRKYRLDEKK